MGERDPRIDDYIANAEPFARPILARLRALVHEACPQADETIKWGMPFFVSGGASLCHMAGIQAPRRLRLLAPCRSDGRRASGRGHGQLREAKRADTRAKRIAQAVEWLAEGKSRNWKYERC